MVPVTQAQPRPTREFAIASLTGVFKEAAENLPIDVAMKTLIELETERKPTEVDYFLRRNLWKQVELVQNGVIPAIEPVSIYGGVCSKQNFEDRVVTSPLRVAWLLIHPSTTHERLEAALSVGLTNLLAFVAEKPNADTIGAFLKAIEILMNRVHGPVIQKIQAQHAHVNLNKPIPGQITARDALGKLEEMKQQLLQEKDVTPVGDGESGRSEV